MNRLRTALLALESDQGLWTVIALLGALFVGAMAFVLQIMGGK